MRRFFLLGLLILLAATARAQFIGYTSPQSVQVRALNAVTVPTTFVVPNLGQSSHFIIYTTTGSPTNIRLVFEASFDGTNFFTIAQEAIDATQSGLNASGYYPVVRVNLVSIVGGVAPTVTAFYSGTSSAPPNPGGIFNRAPLARQTVFSNTAINTNPSATVPTSYGNTSGYLIVNASGGLPAACVLNVFAAQLGLGGSSGFALIAAAPITAAINGVYIVPDFGAQSAFISTGGCGGAGAVTVTVEYYFLPPTYVIGPSNTGIRFTSNNTFVVKGSPGILHNLVINNTGTTAGTATLFTGVDTTCAATSTTIAVVSIPANGTPFQLNYDVRFSTVLCLTTAGLTGFDLTVSAK